MGFRVDCRGRYPYPSKISAIQDLLEPINKAGYEYFLGLLNYYNAFVPHVHQYLAPLYNLLCKEIK